MIVTFEIPGTIWAERINLVGDFNNWDHENLPFRHNRQGNWEIEVEMDLGAEYRFRYLLDGTHWRYDWHADKYAPNPDGGYDSIVVAKVTHSLSLP
jgi:1,4-alpha-glucan branching enzyme